LDDSDIPQQLGLEDRIAALITPSLEHLGYELVRVSVLGRERPTVQIMADRADGALIGVEDCELISRQVGTVLDVEDPVPGEWVLEVSSAGIDRPLVRTKDWNRFIGHQARVEMAIPVPREGAAPQRRFIGLILGADDAVARLRMDDGSEAVLARADIRRAKLVMTDALIEAGANPPSTTH